MKTKRRQDNSAPQTAPADSVPEANCHVEVSARDWQQIVQICESDEINPALQQAALRYAVRHK